MMMRGLNLAARTHQALQADSAQVVVLALLQDERRAISLNHKPDSTVGYVWSTPYQQSS